MAYVNVLDWRCEQVAHWLRGLDDSIYPYCHYFVNNNVDGQKLLNLTVSDLIKLHVEKLGHQEIILEGLELLKNLHYNLDIENLQYVALKLSWKSRSLFNEIKMQEDSKCQSPLPNQKVDTSTMSFVAEVLDALMMLLSWLDKPPFGGSKDKDNPYRSISRDFIRMGIELATNAQRDTFAEEPMEVIKTCCQKIADYSDSLIKDSFDSLILQPASLDVATTKKRPGDDDFGINLGAINPGIHIISEVRFGSLAYQCGRIHVGDEIVQINYQTVVGWTSKNVIQLLNQEQPTPGLILTLKKRPKHSMSGQMFTIQNFRIPARNEATNVFNNLPSPRAELLVAPDVKFPIQKKTVDKQRQEELKDDIKTDLTDGSDPGSIIDEDDDDDIDNEIYLPTTSSTKDISPTQSVRSLLMRPRSTPIRRATISAGSPTKHQPYINVSEIWTGMFDTSKSNKSNNSDGGSKQSSSSSTMQSTDSGCATMYSPSMMYNVQDKYTRPITIGPEYINMLESSKNNPKDDYINLFACSTVVGKRDPPPPPLLLPKLPVPKPRLNVSLSRDSSIEETSGISRKKRPVPQPRSFPPKTSSTVSKSASKILMSSDVQPVPSSSIKIYKKYPVSTSALPDAPPPVPPPPVPLSESESSEEDLPPALPARQSSKRSNLNIPYYVSDISRHEGEMK